MKLQLVNIVKAHLALLIIIMSSCSPSGNDDNPGPNNDTSFFLLFDCDSTLCGGFSRV